MVKCRGFEDSESVPKACGGTFSTCRKRLAPEVSASKTGQVLKKATHGHVANVPPQPSGTDSQPQPPDGDTWARWKRAPQPSGTDSETIVEARFQRAGRNQVPKPATHRHGRVFVDAPSAERSKMVRRRRLDAPYLLLGNFQNVGQ